jgi:hypothetical protein
VVVAGAGGVFPEEAAAPGEEDGAAPGVSLLGELGGVDDGGAGVDGAGAGGVTIVVSLFSAGAGGVTIVVSLLSAGAGVVTTVVSLSGVVMVVSLVTGGVSTRCSQPAQREANARAITVFFMR